jgi:hypothetical protein
MTDTDQISLPVESGLAVDNGSVVDTSSGRSIASSEMRLSGNPYFQQAGNWISIDPANMAPGHLYRASFHFWASPVYANGDTYVRLRVTYDHQRRWGLEALVSCDQTVTASPALRDSATSIDFAQ